MILSTGLLNNLPYSSNTLEMPPLYAYSTFLCHIIIHLQLHTLTIYHLMNDNIPIGARNSANDVKLLQSPVWLINWIYLWLHVEVGGKIETWLSFIIAEPHNTQISILIKEPNYAWIKIDRVIISASTIPGHNGIVCDFDPGLYFFLFLCSWHSW